LGFKWKRKSTKIRIKKVCADGGIEGGAGGGGE
jgi:hypothetical protein